ncbi:dTDP-4-amino-4,6-dideoxygalactose transaminase [Clostridium cochlearium]|uniref:dTDP-4-amino-4,6-dideoxygalactose transaminase n=1 Tax=Clostridium cochlearium TaxID=1494 RepID=A0ABY0QPI0_CLOCO|nr:DegT/DnrJ/EryC1/StrS family aminotransferase [Clostridium cochlearium]SDL43864.1 dTDP-4-amino-4,6-dideoxygalactose transaminase [Clostridium cochlearium]
MKVNFYESQREYKEKKQQFDNAIQGIIERGSFILGNEVRTFEEELKEFTGAKHAIGVASGTDALVIASDILGFKDGKEVITTPFTFLASTSCIAKHKAIPVFVDIDEESCGMDVTQIEDKINENTVGILPIHLFNQMCDMDSIMKMANQYDLKVLEDAAEAFGMRWQMKGEEIYKHAGTIGEIGVFSFFPTKTLGGYGDGGMIVTNSDELNEKCRMFRVHGASKKYHYDYIGYNSRLDAIQASILRVKLKYINNAIENRARIAKRYTDNLKGMSHVKVQGIKQEQKNVYYVFNIFAESRDDLMAFLSSKGIATSIYYPKPLHIQKCFEYLGYKEGQFPVTEAMCKKILALPIYPELRDEEVDYVCDCIREFYK